MGRRAIIAAKERADMTLAAVEANSAIHARNEATMLLGGVAFPTPEAMATLDAMTADAVVIMDRTGTVDSADLKRFHDEVKDLMPTTFGQKGGEGPTRGKKAVVYEVTLPNGDKMKKRVFNPRREGDLIATGFMTNDRTPKPHVVVWEGEPVWEGEFGRLKATRVS